MNTYFNFKYTTWLETLSEADRKDYYDTFIAPSFEEYVKNEIASVTVESVAIKELTARGHQSTILDAVIKHTELRQVVIDAYISKDPIRFLERYLQLQLARTKMPIHIVVGGLPSKDAIEVGKAYMVLSEELADIANTVWREAVFNLGWTIRATYEDIILQA